MTIEPLISIVIPAYNSETTIDETLRSVRAQSYKNLEILVIDDGSSDTTNEIAQRHSLIDPRIRIIVQKNAGVAKARNNGWKQAKSDLIAFIDADDLWTEDKIKEQAKAFMAAEDKVGLVYTGYAVIDSDNDILHVAHSHKWEGNVLPHILAGNFIGNGSSVLVKREALMEVDGFDSSLHEKGAQGCEDFLFYCRVAEKYHFASVPHPMVGYRLQPNNMSSNLSRMLKSHIIAVKMMRNRQPQFSKILNTSIKNYALWLMEQAVERCQMYYLIAIVIIMLINFPKIGFRLLLRKLPRKFMRLLKRYVKLKLGLPVFQRRKTGRKFITGYME